MANADALGGGGFEFIAESDVFEFEHWPLERRKIDEQDARERAALLLFRHVAVVIGFRVEAFVGDDGIPAGFLSWTTRRPGHVLLTIILPLVVVLLFAAAGVGFAMLH